jgi:hypothetical protein
MWCAVFPFQRAPLAGPATLACEPALPFRFESGKTEMSDVKQPSKPLDCYLAGTKCESTTAPSNSSWLKRSDKRADAFRRGDAFPESEKKPTDARR